MPPESLRALVVDDHEAWRKQIAAMIRDAEGWQVAGEAADGKTAVSSAASLRPDVIVLDIELPELSGINAAARILAADPSARILFLTGHRAPEIVEAALDTGARGYVVKLYAAQELLPAMQAVAGGQRFVSAVAGGRALTAKLHEHPEVGRVHEAGFYMADATLIDGYERYAVDALSAGKSVIAVTSEARRDELRRRLRLRGLDIDGAVTRGEYMELAVADVLAPMMVQGMPDETLFWKGGVPLFLRAARACRLDHPAVAAFGDCAASLWDAGQLDAAIRLEQLWDDMTSTFNLDVFCGYAIDAGREPEGDTYRRLCAAHSATHSR